MSGASAPNGGKTEVPYAPGTSPFQVKGTLWMGVRTYVDEHMIGGSSELLQTLDREHAAFFGQLFVAAGWYDLCPMLAITRVIAAKRGLAHMDQVQHTATWHGQQDLKGIYKTLLKQTTPNAICRRFASIYGQLYNFGKVEVVREEAKRVESCAYGMPELLSEWWMKATEFYMKPILVGAGAKNPKMIWRGAAADGEREGMRLLRLPSHTTWD